MFGFGEKENSPCNQRERPFPNLIHVGIRESSSQGDEIESSGSRKGDNGKARPGNSKIHNS